MEVLYATKPLGLGLSINIAWQVVFKLFVRLFQSILQEAVLLQTWLLLMDVVATSVSSWLPLEAGSVQEAGLTAPIAGTALDPIPEKIKY